MHLRRRSMFRNAAKDTHPAKMFCEPASNISGRLRRLSARSIPPAPGFVNATCRYGQSAAQGWARRTRPVEAGCFASIAGGRIGRDAKLPPQLGQAPRSTLAAQAAQNVHS